MYIFVLIYTPKSRRYYIISRQITNTLIPNNLERIVLLYLELQFPLSAISLRFAARIPPQSGLRENCFDDFYISENKAFIEYLKLHLKINKV